MRSYIVDIRLANAQNPIVRQYALPDYTSGNMRGKVLSKDELKEIQAAGAQAQVLTLNAERYAIPEILFHPSDVGESLRGMRGRCVTNALPACFSTIGIQQMGIAETVAHVIGLMPADEQDEQGLFWANIGFMGGLTFTEHLGERL
jgi:actin-related protein 6